MKKLILIFLYLPLASVAANMSDPYHSCVNASNKLESPADRDAKKINCFNSNRVSKSVDQCLSLARILEHTSSSDSLILSCINNHILDMKSDECVKTAKKLYYSENRDKAIWQCLEYTSIKRKGCKSISDEMTLPHNKTAALNYCLTKN